ncbi:MAG: DUF3592 domain-containing protein, partial [Clostridia bacterium]|nr:DUF3592 domain-containing protein [Clostridia bacterium]
MKRRKIFCGWEGWVGLAALLIGLGLTAFSIWYLTDTVFKDMDYIRIEATVVEIAEVRVKHPGEVSKIRYAEVAEYSVDGVTYKAQNNSASTAPKKVGSKITVAYNPENPSECFFPSSNYSVVVLVFVLSAGFTAAGGICLSIEAKERKMEKILAKIPQAEFITSAASKEQFIESEKPIIAVCGKSNVGKSSFINMVTN